MARLTLHTEDLFVGASVLQYHGELGEEPCARAVWEVQNDSCIETGTSGVEHHLEQSSEHLRDAPAVRFHLSVRSQTRHIHASSSVSSGPNWTKEM